MPVHTSPPDCTIVHSRPLASPASIQFVRILPSEISTEDLDAAAFPPIVRPSTLKSSTLPVTSRRPEPPLTTPILPRPDIVMVPCPPARKTVVLFAAPRFRTEFDASASLVRMMTSFALSALLRFSMPVMKPDSVAVTGSPSA